MNVPKREKNSLILNSVIMNEEVKNGRKAATLICIQLSANS